MMGDAGNLQEVVATTVTMEVETATVIKEPMTMTTKVLAMPHVDAAEDHQAAGAVGRQEMDRVVTRAMDSELQDDVDAIRPVTPSRRSRIGLEQRANSLS
jgi:hypothetical protein